MNGTIPLTNRFLKYNQPIRWILLLALLAGVFYPSVNVSSSPSAEKLADGATAYDLIVAMNSLRASNGYSQLVEDPTIDAVAQSTAEIMAANHMSWHIGNVSGRLQNAGFGGGGKVQATENFAAGNYSIDEVMVVWSDAAHMLPATNSAYCNVGAGVAKSDNGLTYYVLQAAYVSGKSCGSYTSSSGSTTSQKGSTTGGGVPGVITPVKVATPDADGNVYHVVQPGQSFWAIAVAYKVTIKDIEKFNNLSSNARLQIGEKLLIPGPNTKGYATPTPVGMFLTSTPGPDGKIVHVVEAYQTLSTISQAYGVSVEKIAAYSGIQKDSTLSIGQKLIIHPSNITPSPTPRPLTPIEKLTPASDGKYYHVVKNGENAAYIADLYKIKLNDLLAWNGLNGYSILQPNQKLVLAVTPPATITPTPNPATATFTATAVPPTQTPTLSPTPTVTATLVVEAASIDSTSIVWLILGGLAVVGISLIAAFSRKK